MIIKRFESFGELGKEVDEKDFEKSIFQDIWYAKVFGKHFCNLCDIYILGVWDDENELACYGFFEKISGNKVVFLGMKPVLGKEEVTDFGEVVWKQETRNKKFEIKKEVGGIWKEIFRYFKNEGFSFLQLNYVREDSESFGYFKDCDGVKIERIETSPFIDLNGFKNWERYLMGVERKKRKEIRRKIRRLKESGKDFSFEFLDEISKSDFEDFIRLHKLSDSQKDKFMSEDMKKFFWDVVKEKKKGTKTRLAFLNIEGVRIAAMLFFEKDKKYYLYNSGYNPEYKDFSVGVILVAKIIKKAIENGIEVCDFLRGDERYKYDLGAKDLWLYKIVVKL